LSVNLQQEIPEAMKPRRIEIATSNAAKTAKREQPRPQAVETAA
jgi:hypothetical protein